MPSGKPKALEKAEPEIAQAYEKAYASKGQVTVVAESIPLEAAERLHRKLKAVRAGFIKYLPPTHERHQDALNLRIKISKTHRGVPQGWRKVMLCIEERRLRPSEEYELAKERLWAKWGSSFGNS